MRNNREVEGRVVTGSEEKDGVDGWGQSPSTPGRTRVGVRVGVVVETPHTPPEGVRRGVRSPTRSSSSLLFAIRYHCLTVKLNF